jgi:hypothetical protein
MEFMNYTIEIEADSTWSVPFVSKDWRKKHWFCSITDGNRAITWDCYGGSMAELKETEALYYLLSDAESFIDIHTLDDVADEFGYTDYQEIKNVYNGLRDSYNKAIQFFGTEERFVEVLEELRQEYDY